MSFFASELKLKPRQRKLVGFFDDFKLKTPEEKLEYTIKTMNDPNRYEKQSQRGEKGDDYGNLDSLMDRKD